MYSKIADDTCATSDEDARSNRDESSSGRYGNEAYDRTYACAKSGRLSPFTTVKKDPGEHRRGGCRICREECFRGESVSGERGAGVKPEPPEPQHSCSEKYVGDVSWNLRGVLFVSGALTEKERSGESCQSTRHMHNRTASEVENSPLT